jgi:hypothetical protein
MTDVLKLGKRIFTVGVVVTTILWSLGVAALVPAVANAAVCPTLAAGDMVKVVGKAAIYTVNNDLKILYFPSGDEFKSWNSNESYGGYVSITQECFDSLSVPNTYPGAANYRPGSWVVKRPSSDQLYVVLPGNKLSKITTADATALYGASYKVKTVADAFWPHYVNRGTDINGLAHEGMLLIKDGKNWYVDAGNVLREITATGWTANRFKTAFLHTVAASYLTGFTTGAIIDAAIPAVTDRTQSGGVITPTAGNLTVSLAADNPAATNIADGTAYNAILKLTLSAGSGTIKVNGITVTKTGLIASTNITGVSIWDKAGNRHGDVMQSLTSDNKVTIGFAGNPILVGAGSPETLLVRVNIKAGVGSGLVGFKVGVAGDVASDGTVGGSFPIEGNQMSIISGSSSLASTTVAALGVGGNALSTDAGNVAIGDTNKEIGKFRFTEQTGNEDVVISKITLYFEGSLQDKDLKNVKILAPDGSTLGTGDALVDRYITVNLTNPYTLPKSTSRDLSVRADIADGSTHGFRVHIQNDYDMMLKGASTGFYILPSGFTDQKDAATGWFTMKSGSLTVNKNPASAAGNVSSGAQSISLAKFDVKAVGENMELRKMGIMITKVGGHNLTGNVAVRDVANGTTYMTVAASDANLYTGYQYNLSSYISMTSNETRTLEVVGNVDSNATSGEKYTVAIGHFYGKRMSTLDFVDNLPSALNNGTPGNQLSVNPTGMTCNKDTSMGNVTRAGGATTEIGQYICTAGTSEDVRLTGINISFGNTGSAANTFQNVELWDGATQLGSTLSTVASGSNNFSFDVTITKSQTKTIMLKAYITAGATGIVSSSISSYNYTGKDSGNSNSGTNVPVVGQNVQVGSGKITLTTISDASTAAHIYGPGATGIQLGKWKIQATNDNVTLNKLTFTTRDIGTGLDATTLGDFSTLSLYDGTTKLADASYVAGDVVFTGMTDKIAMDGYVNLTLKGTVNGSGVITANTPVAFVVKSDDPTDIELRSDAGSLLGTADINAGTAETRFATSTPLMFHDAYPTMAAVNLASISPNTQSQVFKFTITNSGTRDLRVGSTTINFSSSGMVGGSITDFKLWEDNGAGGLGTQFTSGVALTLTSGTPAGAVSFNSSIALNNLFNNLVVSPGSSRTFIVTADTQAALTGVTSGGAVYISGKIGGATGWSGTAWNDGNLQYFYIPAGGTEQGPFYHSDSFEVAGTSAQIK